MLECALLFNYTFSLGDLNSSHSLKYYKYAIFYTSIYRTELTPLSSKFTHSVTYLTTTDGPNIPKKEFLIPKPSHP